MEYVGYVLPMKDPGAQRIPGVCRWIKQCGKTGSNLPVMKIRGFSDLNVTSVKGNLTTGQAIVPYPGRQLFLNIRRCDKQVPDAVVDLR